MEPVERGLDSRSPDQTRELGVRLGRVLERGDFVGFIGDLGAGKTHFIRGVAEGVEVAPEQVASPTFAIVYPYEGGRIPLYHADLYRLADYDELYATGFMDLGPDGAMLVEWIDKVPDAAPRDFLLLRFEHVAGADEERRITVSPTGPRAHDLVRRWLGAAQA